MTDSSPPRRQRRRRLLLIGVLAFVACLLASAAWIAWTLDSDRIGRLVTGRFSALLGRPVAASGVETSLLRGEFVLRGLQIGRIGRDPGLEGPPTPAFSIDAVQGRLSWRSLIPALLHLESLSVEGVSLWGLDDGGRPAPASAPLAPTFEALAARLSFSTDRMSVSGTTIGYRNRPTPWEIRADDVALDFRTTGEGGMDGEIRSGRGVIRLWERPDLLMALTAGFRIRGDKLHLDQVGLRSDLLAVDMEGTLDLDDALAGPLKMTGSGDAGGLGRFLFDFEGLETVDDSWFRFAGTAEFQETGLAVDGDFVLSAGRFYGVPLQDWNGRLHWDPERIEIVSSEGRAAGGAANLRLLQLQPREENPAVIQLTLENGSFASATAGLFGTSTTLRSRMSVNADLRMPLTDPLLMTGTIGAVGTRPDGATPASPASPASMVQPFGFVLDLEIDEQGTTVRRLTVEGAAFRGSAEGHYPREGPARFSVEALAGEAAEADAVQQELRRVLFAEDPETILWDVSGGGGFEGTVEGRWPDLVMAGEVEGRQMRFSTIHTDSLLATGRITRETIRLDALTARHDDSRITASGIFERGPGAFPDMEFKAVWDRWDAREIIDFLEWDLEAEGTATGRSDTVRRNERYSGGGSVVGTDGAVLEQPFDEVLVSWTMDGETARLAPMRGAFRDGAAEGALDIGLVGWELDGVITGTDYPLTPGLAPEWISIRSDFDLEIGGDLLVPELRLEARVPAVAVLGLPLGPGTIEGTVLGEDFQGAGTLDSGAASFSMAGVVPLGTDGAGKVTIREVDVAPILLDAAGQRGLSMVVSGEGNFHIEDPLDEWMTGTATLEDLVISTPDFAVATSGPTGIRLQDARVHIEGLGLAQGDSGVRLAGSVGLDDQLLDLTLSGRISLLAAEPFLEGLTSQGQFDINAEIVGPLTAPEAVGEGTVQGGVFRIEGFPHALSAVEGSITFDHRTLRIAEMIGTMGSGDAVVSGSISVEDAAIGAVDLRVRLTDSRLRYPRDLSATLDADLRVVGDRGGRLLSGEVRLNEAVWSREYELFTSILADVNAVAEPGDTTDRGFLDELRMDVRVETDSPFAVRNSIFQLDAAADFGLRGTAGSPALLGRADLVGGEMYFGAHRFQIVSGSADFVDPEGIEPIFDIEAETRVRSYRVRLRASGTTEHIEANLSSEPPLREADILRLLSGAPEQDLLRAASDDDVAVASAATLLSQQLSNMIGRRAGRVFGIDRLSIDPFLIGRFSNPAARVTLGKQVSSDLSVRYSSSLSSAEESIIVVEYTPRGPVSWIFSRDQDGSLGVDVRFHRSF